MPSLSWWHWSILSKTGRIDTMTPLRLTTEAQRLEARTADRLVALSASPSNPLLDGEPIGLVFLVSGEQRIVSIKLWDKLYGPLPNKGYASNGCTRSPDYWFGVPVWVACVAHDWHYDPLGPMLDRVIADWHFRRNLWVVARYSGAGRLKAGAVSLFYWKAVVLIGEKYFKKQAGVSP